jgi:pSer/pThr/pTyr-binding forkhead associated (FHA) protein
LVTVSRPDASCNTTRAVPLPVTAGTLLMRKGPLSICWDEVRTLFTKTSTVEGTAALPAADGNGNVTRSGRRAKLRCAWSPPIRIGRVQASAPLISSPAR